MNNLEELEEKFSPEFPEQVCKRTEKLLEEENVVGLMELFVLTGASAAVKTAITKKWPPKPLQRLFASVLTLLESRPRNE
jgi:hypothetical protein